MDTMDPCYKMCKFNLRHDWVVKPPSEHAGLYTYQMGNDLELCSLLCVGQLQEIDFDDTILTEYVRFDTDIHNPL